MIQRLSHFRALIRLPAKNIFKNISLNNYCTCKASSMDKSFFESKIRDIAPNLSNDRHKGQAGRIGVFGGSLEYTGAPYFAAISSLKVGGDLAYIFCMKEAAPIIKSFSPELIVLPYLNATNPIEKIEPWLDRLHVVLIGPGLGRDPETLSVIEKIINICCTKRKPLVIDADGLFLLAQPKKINLIKNYPAPVILTPNAMEFARLVGQDSITGLKKAELSKSLLDNVGSNVTILCKDHIDEIINNGRSFTGPEGGSGRRCGGQGDLLAGSLSIFLNWALNLEKKDIFDHRPILAAYAASKMTRLCNEEGFKKFGRSMTVTDMIQEIHYVFDKHFERN